MIASHTPRPVLVSLCGTFLRREMLHVYRQACAVEAYDHWVVTRRRENADWFPFPQVVTLRKHPLRGLHRLFYRLRGRRVPFTASETRQMLRFTQARQAAVVHVYLGNVASRALGYLARERAARVVSFHGGDLSHDASPAELQRLGQHSDLFLARSHSLADALRQRGLPAEKIRLNPTGVPLPDAFTARRPPPVGQPVRLLQACRFVAKKGLDVTLQATARLNRAGREAILDLAGDGPEEPALRALAAQLGIADRVRFLGFLDNPSLLRLLPEYDIFVHPSRTTASGDREGIPNSLLEAMAAGLPVVATRHSGIPEAVTDRENGLLIDQADPEALARAIETLLDQPHLYAALSQAANATVASRFSISACARTLEASYREAIALSLTVRQPIR